LPALRIERAQVRGKVFIDEHPRAPGLGARNRTDLCAAAQFLGMHPEELGCFDQRERSHLALRWFKAVAVIVVTGLDKSQ
jgi:hypothetical protein